MITDNDTTPTLTTDKHSWSAICRQHQVPGAVISQTLQGITSRDQFGQCVNHQEAAKSVTDQTLFEAGSLSKTVTAYLIYLLESRGELTPMKPLYEQLSTRPQRSEWLKGLEDRLSLERATRITYEMALTHTSGFEGWRAHQPLQITFEPGARFAYSGEGYLILQRFLEIQFDTPIEHLFQRLVFSPLGMDQSSFCCPNDPKYQVATGHDHRGQPLPKYRKARPVIAGSLHTCLADYTRFIDQALFQDKTLTGHNHPSFHAWLKEHITQTPIPGITWAKGWGIAQPNDASADEFLWHWGDTGGFHCFIIVNIKSKDRLNFFTNSQNGLKTLSTVFARRRYPIHKSQTCAINALIGAITNNKHGLERYWFDYDAPKSFYRLTYA